MTEKENIEVVFSFDTTGSMYPCLSQVRQRVEWAVRKLFSEVPNIRIGIIAHGDYCDKNSTYVVKKHNLSRDAESLCRFVRNVEPTGGGDAPECYELVLHEARSLDWTHGKSKVVVLIGDDVPHGPNEAQNYKKLDWRNEINLLLEMGVNVYGVQALNRSHATQFYREIAHKTGGYHLTLDQFASVTDMLLAICYKQAGSAQLQAWESEVEKSGRMNRNLDSVFATLSGRKAKTRYARARDLEAVPPGRFQVMTVDEDQVIRDLVEDNGLLFQKGRGFYELTKAETIQGYKEVVLMDNATGDLYTGAKARQMLSLPEGETAKIRPVVPDGFTAFVQSTSYNRRLVGGTRFLYEVDLSR
ncbi:MAG: VWA domain-containing protein [Candidatus Harrisonbacteria bacterium]|nr:VWA domain-containing protein [Candidatus Harrisonbacteria bacterium]